LEKIHHTNRRKKNKEKGGKKYSDQVRAQTLKIVFEYTKQRLRIFSDKEEKKESADQGFSRE